jgi:dynein heavy chain
MGDDDFTIAGMISSEKEKVPFNKMVKVKPGMGVEVWLNDLEKNMIDAMVKFIKEGYRDWQAKMDQGILRKVWVMEHFG